ncbi:M14 family zinc carboxypeptidase [candidate division KSB1 bacterium]
MRRTVLLTGFLIFLAATLAAAQSWEFYPNGTYNSRITRPQDFLGYDLGERFTMHHRMMDYFENLAEESDRVQYHQYGMTYELRPLTYLIITAPENFSRLDEIRQNNLKLADPRTLQSDDEAESIIKNNPSIAWMGYNVHGNESCGMEAAILTAYQLAAGTDRETTELLRNLVIIIDPLLNPDGRDSYALNYNKALDKKANPLPFAMEHSAGGGGRTNHYSVDLNRDWVFVTQQETRQRHELYLQWKPQVAGDFHEMGSGSTYFFFPAASPINANYPDQVKKWQRMYGEGNARAFDQFGWKYYTHEGFDMYYPGYGDSWPSLYGATGMTYEQGGGGAGVSLKRGENDFLTLRKRLWGHFTASIATLKVSSDNREARLRDFYEFFTTALEEGKNGTIREIVIPPPKNPLTFNILLETLLVQGVEIEKATEAFKANKTHGYFGEPVADKDFPAGSFIIKLAQPNKRLINIMFEPEQALPDTFFYDLSAWAYPFSTNIETYWTESSSDVQTVRVTGPIALQGNIADAPAGYAYLMPLKGIETTLACYELIQKDVTGGIANRDITIGGREYKRGTAVFYVHNPKDIDVHRLVRETADKYGVTMYGVNTGFADKGVDLGSGRIAKFVKPKIGIVGGTGNIRHMFDHRYNIDFTAIDAGRLSSLDIEEINVIIVSGNIGSSLNDDAALNGFKDWLRQGGTYVGWGGGTSFAISENAGLANFKLAPAPEKDKEVKDKEDEEQKRLTVEERERSRKAQASPGYFVKAHLDITHPLAYGMHETISVLKSGTTAFELETRGGIVGVFAKENTKLSGYVFPDNLERIKDKGYLAYATSGRGKVILFSDNPTYREFLTGLEGLFLNAALLMPSQGGGRR